MPNEPSQSVLRQLAPAPRGGRTVSKSIAPKQRQPVAAACEACRKHKIKCNGLRPQCSSCIRTKRPCHYTTQPSETRASALKRRQNHAEQQFRDIHRSHWVLQQLLRVLATSTNIDTATIFQQLRQGSDPALILQHIEDGRLDLQLNHPADATKRPPDGFTQDQAHQHTTDKQPSRACSFGADQNEYGELFRRLKSAEQEQGVKVLHRLHQGQDISGMLHLVEDPTLMFQNAALQNHGAVGDI